MKELISHTTPNKLNSGNGPLYDSQGKQNLTRLNESIANSETYDTQSKNNKIVNSAICHETNTGIEKNIGSNVKTQLGILTYLTYGQKFIKFSYTHICHKRNHTLHNIIASVH